MVTDRLLEIAEKTVKFATKLKVDQVEAVAFLIDSALTRYANSQIHQNIATKTGGVSMKVVVDKRVGALRANYLEKRQVEEAVKTALKIAKVTPPNKDFKSLPEPAKWTPIKGTFDKRTAECTPDFRAEKVKAAIDTAHSKSRLVKAVAGSFSADSLAFAVVNSLGVSAWATMSSTSFQTTVISKSKGSQGYGSAEQYARKVSELDPVGVADQAAETSVKSINPKKIAVGDYEVVLSPRAVATLMSYLGYIGFSATSYQDGQSFVKYNLDKQVFDNKLTVTDDPRNPKTLYAFPIDGEGVPKKKMQLVEKGRVSERSICYDSFTAGREKGKKSTGHALSSIFIYADRPTPSNVVVASDDATIEEMIHETKHGIFVTRFHYTNPIEPTKAILTGLTRDGTFLIENGEISKPVMNLRYTDSMLSALKEISMIGNKAETVDTVITPAMKLAKLRFTGITQY
jgi:predicted Zn-dependent protease